MTNEVIKLVYMTNYVTYLVKNIVTPPQPCIIRGSPERICQQMCDEINLAIYWR